MLTVQVLSSDGSQEVGKISKKWSGLAKEYFTDADNFGVQCKLHYLNRVLEINFLLFFV